MVGARAKKFRPQGLDFTHTKLPRDFSFVVPRKLAGHADFSKEPEGMRQQLAEIATLGVQGVVCLLETAADASLFADAGIQYLHLPVKDLTPPTYPQLMEGVEFIDQVNSKGGAVSVHCWQGVGRTGCLIAAWMMVRQNMCPTSAIQKVRDARPGSVHKQCQVEALHLFHATLHGQPPPSLVPVDPQCAGKSRRGEDKGSKWYLNPELESSEEALAGQDAAGSPHSAAPVGSSQSLVSLISATSTSPDGSYSVTAGLGTLRVGSPSSGTASVVDCIQVDSPVAVFSPTKKGRRTGSWGDAGPDEAVDDTEGGDVDMDAGDGAGLDMAMGLLDSRGASKWGCDAARGDGVAQQLTTNSNGSEEERTAGPSPDRPPSVPNSPVSSLMAQGGPFRVRHASGIPGSILNHGIDQSAFPRLVSDPLPPQKKLNTNTSPVPGPHHPNRFSYSSPPTADTNPLLGNAWGQTSGSSHFLPAVPLPPAGYDPNPKLPSRQRSFSPGFSSSAATLQPLKRTLAPRQRSMSPSVALLSSGFAGGSSKLPSSGSGSGSLNLLSSGSGLTPRSNISAPGTPSRIKQH